MFPLKDNIPTERFPVVTVALILANVLFYLLFQHGLIKLPQDERKTVDYGAIPYEITHPGKECGTSARLASGERLGTQGQVVCEGERVPLSDGSEGTVGTTPSGPSTWLTLLTAMFMHGGILHILGNMLFLWIFGNNVEDSMGRGKFLLFYLLGGLAALAGQVLVDPSSTAPTIGASGAVAAVLGGYILLFPRARVLTLVFIIFFFTLVELPAVVMLGLWFLQQAFFGAQDLTNPTGGGGGVAYFAHIGGFAFGLLLIRAFARRQKTLPPRYPVY